MCMWTWSEWLKSVGISLREPIISNELKEIDEKFIKKHEMKLFVNVSGNAYILFGAYKSKLFPFFL